MFNWIRGRGKKTAKVKTIKRGWYKLVLIAIAIISGGGLAYWGQTMRNPVVITLGFALLVVGVYCFFKTGDIFGTRILPGRKALTHPANALIIYPDELEFDYIKNPPGHQQRCINDGKWYSILLGKRGEKKHTVFKLPDIKAATRHYDPREFANPVSMPANAKIFEPDPNIVKAIAIGILAILIGAEFFTIIILVG